MLTLQLKDGRTLAYEVYGDPDGVPVIFNHGLSDSRLIHYPDDEFTKSLGVRIVAVDQPGVGGSSPQPGRRLRDWAKDIEQLVDALDIEQFAVAGHSGGGPHALAIAAHLPDRVTCGVLAAPAGPLDLPGFADIVESKAAISLVKLSRFPIAFRPLLRISMGAIAWWANSDMSRYLNIVAKSDRTNGNPETFLADPKQQQMFEESFRAGFVQGAEGIVEMIEALFTDWGFALADVSQHFDIFFGDLDASLKPEMGQAISNAMPDAQFHTWRDTGHYGFVDRQHWKEFFSPVGK
ncbi:MAG: alpha/beta hydrolase [Cyanobacteria bacterium J06650_10]